MSETFKLEATTKSGKTITINEKKFSKAIREFISELNDADKKAFIAQLKAGKTPEVVTKKEEPAPETPETFIPIIIEPEPVTPEIVATAPIVVENKEETKAAKRKTREIVSKLVDKENEKRELENESREIVESFKKTFRFDPMEEVPHFDTMNAGERRLLYNNLQQVKLDYIQREANRAFAERMDATGKSIAGYAKKISIGLRRNYFLDLDKKAAKEKAEASGADMYRNAIAMLADSMSKTGLPVAWDKNSSKGYRIEYVTGLKDLSEEDLELVKKFNERATKFGEIPHEWALAGGQVEKVFAGNISTRNNKSDFKNAKKEFETGKEEIMDILRNQFGNDETKIFQYLSQIENNVLFNQMINSDPNALQAMEDIKTSNSWLAGLKKNQVGEKGVYFAAGMIARGSATLASVGSAAVIPIAAALAGIRGAFKISEGIYEKEKAGRHGARSADDVTQALLAKYKTIENRTHETKDKTGSVVSVRETTNINLRIEQLTARVEQIKKELDENTDDSKTDDLEHRLNMAMETLQNRLAYIQGKIDKGEINYGGDDVRILNQHNLLATINTAYGVVWIDKALKEKKVGKDLEKRIEKIYHAGRTRNIQKVKLYTTGVIKAATFGAITAKFGYEFRGWLNTPSEPVAHEILPPGHAHVTAAAAAALPTKEALEIPKFELKSDTYNQPLVDVDKVPEVTLVDEKSQAAINYLKFHSDTSVADAPTVPTPEVHEEVAAAVTATPKGEGVNVRDITKDFSITLGKNGVPVQLEKVFHEIALDHMDIPGNELNAEVATKSLNVAANLAKLAQGENVLGASTSVFKDSFHYDPINGTLSINKHADFNQLMKVLENNSDKLFKAGKLADVEEYAAKINENSWLARAHADHVSKGFEIGGDKQIDTGIHGHDDMTAEDIEHFKQAEITAKTDAIKAKMGVTSNANDIANLPNIKNGVGGGGDYDPQQQTTPQTGKYPPPGTEPFPNKVKAPSTPGATGKYPPPGTEPFEPSAKPKINPNTNIRKEILPQKTQPPTNIPEENIRKEILPTKRDTAAAKANDGIGRIEEPEKRIPPAAPKVTPKVNFEAPQIQQEHVFQKIFSTKDISKSDIWNANKTKPAADLFLVTEDQIVSSPKPELQQLWSLQQLLSEKTLLKPFKGESLEKFLTRAIRSYVGNNKSQPLENVYNESLDNLAKIQAKYVQ